MSVGVCSRCGKKGEVEYGVDGLPYCSNCIFYGMYKQCSRCRMYLPATELQQYKGQWLCPNCLLEEREREKEKEEAELKEKRPKTQELSYSTTCDRCGKETDVLYIFNNKRLCASCLKEEQEKTQFTARRPFSPATKVVVRKGKPLLQRIIDAVLIFFGLKKKEKETEIIAIKNKKEPDVFAGKEPLKEKSSEKKVEAHILPEKEPEKEDKFKKFKKE